MTTTRLTTLAAAFALTAAGYAEPADVEQNADETDAAYVVRLVELGAEMRHVSLDAVDA